MSANRSSAWGYVMLLAMVLLWLVSIWLENGRSPVGCLAAADGMTVAVVAAVVVVAAVFVLVFVYCRRRSRASGDEHDYVREMKRRISRQSGRKDRPVSEVGRLDLENGLVWLETNATVPEAEAICKRLKAMKIDFGVRQMHIDNAFHGRYGSGGGLGTKMGVFVREVDFKRASSVAGKVMRGSLR